MKKIAVLYAGLVRDYKICFESFKKNIVDPNPDYKFEYFLCLWDHTHPTNNENNENIPKILVNTEDVIAYFNPRTHLILDYQKQRNIFSNSKEYDEIHQKKIRPGPYSKERFINTFLMQMYGLRKCFEIFQEYSTEYDYILKNRFDFFYYAPSSLPVDDLESDKIYILNINNDRQFIDNICLGKHEPIEIFMKTYDRLVDSKWTPMELWDSSRVELSSRTREEITYFPQHQPVTEIIQETRAGSPEDIFKLNLLNNNIEIYKSLSWATWKYGSPVPCEHARFEDVGNLYVESVNVLRALGSVLDGD